MDTFARAMWQQSRGTVLRDAADTAARLLLETALATLLAKFLQDTASIAAAQIALARLEISMGNAEPARALLVPALNATQQIAGPKHPQMGIARHALAMTDALAGNCAEAITKLTHVLKLDYLATPSSNVLPNYARLDRAWCLIAIGRNSEALADLATAKASLIALAEPAHPRWAEAQLARALLAARAKNFAKAAAHIELAIAANIAQFGEHHPLTEISQRWRSVTRTATNRLKTTSTLRGKPDLTLAGQRLALFSTVWQAAEKPPQ